MSDIEPGGTMVTCKAPHLRVYRLLCPSLAKLLSHPWSHCGYLFLVLCSKTGQENVNEHPLVEPVCRKRVLISSFFQ